MEDSVSPARHPGSVDPPLWKPAIHNIVFDLGGVLFAWNPAAIVASVFDDPATRDRARKEVLEHDDWKALDRGAISEAEARARFVKRTGLDGAAIDRLRAATQESVKPLQGAVQLLEALKAGPRALRLFVLSNVSEQTYRFLRERYDFWNLFSGVVVSSEEKLLKPEAEIYRRLLKRFDLKPVRTLFIDDALENVEAAEALGLRGMVFPGVKRASELIASYLDARRPDVYSIGVRTIEGRDTTLREYADKAMLIVNTASRCGFTRQYAGLEALYERYRAEGLTVLGFPSNSFLWQEPGDESRIQAFCESRFGVTFPLFSKVAVRGRACHPLFRYLTSRQAHGDRTGAVTWNFNKFLLNRAGDFIGRFGSRTSPDDPALVRAIEQTLAADPG